MAKVAYIEKRFKPESLALIKTVNQVIAEYSAQGFDLTLRQVYYQMVARAIIPNNERSYKNLGNLISDGRLAGLIDWNAIEDRTRNLRGNQHWSTPGAAIRSAAYSYHLDHWAGQDNYVEVWVEKDALIGIVGQICRRLDVNHFSCRGYVSQSEMWGAAQRLLRRSNAGQQIVLLHLGDHDPSGKDMSRDIIDRLDIFGVSSIEFRRLALNMEQIEQYAPPPNPAKITDSRARGYIEKYGAESWELDALEPQVISDLIESNVTMYRDAPKYQAVLSKEQQEMGLLERVADDWSIVSDNFDSILDLFGG